MPDQILSQEEIDAMLSGGAGGTKSAPASEEPAAAPPPIVKQVPASPQPATPQPAATGPDPGTQMMLDKLAEKLEDFGAALERINQLEKAIAETNSAIRQMRAEFQNFGGQTQLINSKVDGILANLKTTLGYRAQKTFTCNSCRTKGQVAAKVKCTVCGQENWWGWWPGK